MSKIANFFRSLFRRNSVSYPVPRSWDQAYRTEKYDS